MPGGDVEVVSEGVSDSDRPATERAGPPAISVVVPAYNAARFLGACYASLAAQTFRDWEAIIVDDGSTDGTLALARGFGDPRVTVRTQPNRGPSVARNRGWSLARGGAVLFLDADDTLHPTALARLHAALAGSPEAVAVYGRHRIVGEDGAPHPRHSNWREVPFPSGDLLESFLVENVFANGGQVLARRTALGRAGPFNPALRLAQDWEFWCRLAALGPILFVDGEDEILRFRENVTSNFNTRASDASGHLAAVAEIYGNRLLAARFTETQLARLRKAAVANVLWTAGRVNFRHRRCGTGRALMRRSLAKRFVPRRAAIYAASYLQEWSGIGLVRQLVYFDPPARGTATDRPPHHPSRVRRSPT